METIATPEFAEFWTVDEIAECLPGMIDTTCYKTLWGFIGDGLQPTLDEVWEKLDPAHQQQILDAYAAEYPDDDNEPAFLADPLQF